MLLVLLLVVPLLAIDVMIDVPMLAGARCGETTLKRRQLYSGVSISAMAVVSNGSRQQRR